MRNNGNNYFSHDSNARNSERLIRLRMKHKAAGYGVFFMILERLREEPGYMSVKDYNMIAFDLREDASLIKSVVEDFGLFVFTDDGKYFYSESLRRRMELKDEKSRKRSDAGRKGMANRWENDNAIAKDGGEDNNAITKGSGIDNNAITKGEKNITSKVKESKEKESKENNKEKDKEKDTRAEDVKPLPERCAMTVRYFNEMIGYYKSAIRPVRVLTDERRHKVEAVVLRYDSRQIAAALRNAMTSDYLNGRTPRRKCPADFDWIFEERNFTRIFEGSL